MHAETTLADLPRGGRGVILEINAPEAERRRLAQLGLVPGVSLRCKLRGTGGSPVAFTAHGVTLALRKAQCRQIRLRETGGSAEKTYLLAGNPNVGKSTVFNALTGLRQHTGNWCGKTLSGAEGVCAHRGTRIRLIDTPGTYSVLSAAAEEAAARDIICNVPHDRIICVCDAAGLARGLILALQLIEMDPHTVLCVNMMDEAKRRGISLDLTRLSEMLGVPVIGVTAQKKATLPPLLDAAAADSPPPPVRRYAPEIERAIDMLLPLLPADTACTPRWTALHLLLGDCPFLAYLLENHEIADALHAAHDKLQASGITQSALTEQIAAETVKQAGAICKACRRAPECYLPEETADRLLTGKWLKYPLMLALLLLTFWVTLVGANYPSAWLADCFSRFCTWVHTAADAAGLPPFCTGALIDGMLRGTGWVVSVMLPPMAIFFPLFTLMEDIGILPRIAFNMDSACAGCRACGKQALTMTMGFGCNAVGVTGCRIIESRRERLIAILTNAFIPCNGRFPTLLAVVTVFFAGQDPLGSLRAAGMLTLLILLAIAMSLGVSALLGGTILRGEPSSFVLELPPYRRPQILRVLVRSVLDRTLFVLGRAVTVAAPVSLLIWLLAQGGLLQRLGDLLAPVGALLGMDGVLLLAFLLGLPANEIVLPVAVTAYLGQSVLTDYGSLDSLAALLSAHGWNRVTAICFLVFTLFHAPCATTLLTIRHETKSWRWTALAAFLPTAAGVLLCAGIALIFS